MSTSKTTYEELDPFFGGNTRGRLFVALNYDGTYSVGPNTRDTADTIVNHPIYQLMKANNYNGTVTAVGAHTGKSRADLPDNVISDEFILFVVDVANAHRLIDVPGGAFVQRIDNLNVQLQGVYKNWKNISDDARAFYSEFLNLVSDDKTQTSLDPTLIAMPTKFNLKKVDFKKPDSQILFSHTLPYLPTNAVNEKNEPLDVDYLKLVYDSTIRNAAIRTDIQFGGNLPLDGWETGANGLNAGKFLRGLMYAQKVSVSSQSAQAASNDVYDMVTGNLYSYNANGELVDSNGRAVDAKSYEAAVTSNCAGTGVKDCSGGLIFECLLSGDSSKLSKCLKLYEHKDMFDVANTEIKKIHPRQLIRLIETFGIQIDKHGAIEPYVLWFSNLEGRLAVKMGADKAAKTTKAIFSNEKLLDYIKTIMSIVRSNPALLSKSISVLSDLPSKTGSKLNYFIEPKITRVDALSTQVNYLTQQLNLLPQNFMSSLSMPLGLNNVNLGLQMPWLGLLGMQRGGNMTGGANGCDSTVQHFEQLYRNILNELAAAGKDLDDADKKRVEAAISQLKKNNAKIDAYLKDLYAFLKLNTAVRNVKLSDIHDLSKSTYSNLTSQVSTLQSCINRTTADTVGLMDTLLKGVFTPLISLASGINTQGVRML